MAGGGGGGASSVLLCIAMTLIVNIAILVMMMSSFTTSSLSLVGVNEGNFFMRELTRRQPPCNEIYVVGDGETLHTISDKCGDPFILERNPHIYDPDDVFPGLVIKIRSSYSDY